MTLTDKLSDLYRPIRRVLRPITLGLTLMTSPYCGSGDREEGCDTDSDCHGDRICDYNTGRCVGKDDGNENGDYTPSVAGEWCAIKNTERPEDCLGKEISYVILEQEQSGSSSSGWRVTGSACESFNEDCNIIRDGRIWENRLTFFYEFGDVRVTAEFNLSSDESRLQGNFTNVNRDITIPLTFYKF